MLFYWEKLRTIQDYIMWIALYPFVVFMLCRRSHLAAADFPFPFRIALRYVLYLRLLFSLDIGAVQ